MQSTTGLKSKKLRPASFKNFNTHSVNNSFGSFEFIGILILNGRVTIHESEEDDFRSEFHRNRDRKGFKDTKWKRHYSEVVLNQVVIIYALFFRSKYYYIIHITSSCH